MSVSFGRPYVGWVALGWGEPVVPWWGPRGCRGVARWAGWGGPRVVNNIVIKNHHHVNVNQIRHYQHHGRHGAMVAVDRGRFGHGHVKDARIARFDSAKLAPVRGGDLGIRANRDAYVKAERRGTRPSRGTRERSVVTRQDPGRVRGEARPRTDARIPRGGSQRRASAASAAPPTRMARAERAERRDPVSKPAVSRREPTRERREASPRTPRAQADTLERRGSVSSAPRVGRDRAREAATASEPARSRAATAQKSRGGARGASRVARSNGSQAPSPKQVERRERPQTQARAARSERHGAAREAPARVERGAPARIERAAPRVDRRERAAERKRSDTRVDPGVESSGGDNRRDRGSTR